MANARPTPAIIQDYVQCILGHWAGDLGFSPSVFTTMRAAGLDQADVLFALETGLVTSIMKEEAHETFFEMVGETPDGKRLKLMLSFSPHVDGLCVCEIAQP